MFFNVTQRLGNIFSIFFEIIFSELIFKQLEIVKSDKGPIRNFKILLSYYIVGRLLSFC